MSILPLSVELNAILGQVFELDPRKRISLRELRSKIEMCPRFTVGGGDLVPTPSSEVSEDDLFAIDEVVKNHQHEVLTPPPTPPSLPQEYCTNAAEEEYVSIDYPEPISSPPVIVEAAPEFAPQQPTPQQQQYLVQQQQQQQMMNFQQYAQQQSWQLPAPGWHVSQWGEKFRSANFWRNHAPLGHSIKAY